MVTMSLSAAVWPQFAAQALRGEVSTPVWYGRGGSAMEALDRALINKCLTSSDSFSISYNIYVTEHRAISAIVSTV